MRILVAEGDLRLLRAISAALKADSFAVDQVRNGSQALQLATENPYDIIVLGCCVKQVIGCEVLKRLRAKRVKAPVLMLTARTTVSEKIEMLEAGADDVLVKPFSVREMIARVRVLLRRPSGVFNNLLRVSDLEMDLTRRVVTRNGKHIHLTNREFALLELLMRNAGRPITRSTLIEHVWDASFDGLTNIVDVYINYLRAKIDRDFESKLIHTAYGVGYLLGNLEEANKAA
ncbi:MAG TPA: response regulator transcription factor [Candidatus Angelobacter sp.]|jgi:DNA-binding response OmpR family regulator|nr:response regulator transcription factor [Candidatus Angelobacter sp.]